MNITELHNMADGSFVNATVVGRISSTKNLKTSTGKDMGVGKLGDDNNTIDIQSFDKSFTGYEGKTVELSGKGMKKDSYNGYAKLQIGKAVGITVVGDAGGGTQQTTFADTGRSAPAKKDDDYVPQTLTYLMGAALHATLHDPQADGQPNEDIMAGYAVAMYNAREKAVAIIRSK